MTQLKTYKANFILPNGLPASIRVQTPLAIGTPSGVAMVGRRLASFGVLLTYIETDASQGGQLLDMQSLIVYVQELAKLSPAV